MFAKVDESDFLKGEHRVLRFWAARGVFQKLREQNAGRPKWSFLDGPITANNPMGVHHAWGRTYKDAFQRYFAMTGRELRYQNGFDCQGLWVEVEVEKELGVGTKNDVEALGIDKFVRACKQRVLRFAARQTEQSIRLGFWMDWDDPAVLRTLAEHIADDDPVTVRVPSGEEITDRAEAITARLGNADWGGSYFTFSTENNETIWTFLKKCYERGKVYRGHDVMPWSGRGGSAYSQMEVADGRKLTTHRSCFVRLPVLRGEGDGETPGSVPSPPIAMGGLAAALEAGAREYLLVWTTTPWTLTSNVAAAVNPDLDYVCLQAKRDGAVYYFAADNLEFQRLANEFKDGFGRPEWKWPDGVDKLKTIAQIFKEQGGYEVLGKIKGAEMVGWRYEGPFDDLEAQQTSGGVSGESAREGASPPIAMGGLGTTQSAESETRTGASCHRVIDGGRDFKGSPHVVAGEGTGIVHIAPGCGDVDHQLGIEHDLVVIAPLAEDGRFTREFGPFAGREAIDPDTADLVFEKLREKEMLVYVETYPHIYPHCWRTGDELVFRLVDEWFINMDWRDEIMDVTRAIQWLPASVDGEARELDWLQNMRDWMISKKRFWGLALPVWFDKETGDFEVVGSLAELKERAVEGWDEFEGHTPHRPWIDGIKILNEKTGKLMSRIPDVGNPWLDAGITPFSTMQYNTNREQWEKWYPADFVTECFPGQFRNWFYSLLATATMMRHEQDSAEDKRPFTTLLGHRLVMDELGRPMHKSDGTAIWFEEAAEQLGVDTLRWMYLAQNPAQDLRFGTRHPNAPVALETPEGSISETAEGLPTVRVTSGPADDVRRQVLIPLWNSYAFFINYARLDGFDPTAEPVPFADRPEIDRWVLSNLQALIERTHAAYQEFDSPAACAAAAEFIDDLSNWYIRRNRRRFWRSRDAGDADKTAAYQTLYEVLVTLSKLLAPAIPFLAERMWGNLVGASLDSNAESERGGSDGVLEWGGGELPSFVTDESGRVPESVHLCSFPTVDSSRLDPALNRRMATAQLVVRMGHKLREEQSIRVRQPLAEMRYACRVNDDAAAINDLSEVIREELNVKELSRRDDLDDLVRYTAKPNLKTLGPKYGRLLGAIRQQLPKLDDDALSPLRAGETITVDFAGDEVELTPDDVLFETEQATDWIVAADKSVQIALSTALTSELVLEGMARDFVRHVQQMRKQANLEIEDRILIQFQSETEGDAGARLLHEMANEWSPYICEETLADELINEPGESQHQSEGAVGDVPIEVWITRR